VVDSGTSTGFSTNTFIFPVGIVPTILCTNLQLITTLIRRTSGQSLGTFIQCNVLLDVREQWPGKLRLQPVTYTVTTLTETAPGSGCLSTTTSAYPAITAIESEMEMPPLNCKH
jgi:hypothetical protein